MMRCTPTAYGGPATGAAVTGVGAGTSVGVVAGGAVEVEVLGIDDEDDRRVAATADESPDESPEESRVSTNAPTPEITTTAATATTISPVRRRRARRSCRVTT